jgi:hypothetical protein
LKFSPKLCKKFHGPPRTWLVSLGIARFLFPV